MITSRFRVALGLIGAVVFFAVTAGAQQRPAPAPGGAATSAPAGTSPASAPNAARPVPPVSAVSDDYIIGAEDVLAISVWKNETLSRTVPVRPDGKISLPLLNDIQAAGLTAMQLRDKIAGALRDGAAVECTWTSTTSGTRRSVRAPTRPFCSSRASIRTRSPSCCRASRTGGGYCY